MNNEEKGDIREALHRRILEKIDFSREVEDREILDLIDEELIRGEQSRNLSLNQRKRLRQELFYSIRKLDVLQELIDNSEITEIMINGSEHIFIEEKGEIREYPQHFVSGEKLEDVIQQIVSACNRVVNSSSPIVDARLAGGARVNVVLPPVALNGPVVTIRRFPDRPILFPELLRLGAVSEEITEFLRCVVAAGYNIFVSGGTGSGKTTFLNALSEFIPGRERVITIEDNAELQIRHIPNLVRLETRNANMEGCIEISIRDLIRSALRMRPDRIIVGEVRGSEAIDMLQAMNTGHDGSMSTGHGNSAQDMLARLETMVLMSGLELPLPAVRGQIASAIDLFVHLGRLRDRSRRLLEIHEIVGMEYGKIQLQTLYRFCEEGEEENGRIRGCWTRENVLSDQKKLRAAGLRLAL
ncbi:CpaF family protein [Lachnoclostridium sp. Marseille-P6806]|uniref:CpaF family protein n=1 Tax=Lachnoclostridium sp. Marseille-P6806 TaxID=2364793 RepID=UPI001F5F34C6|nr:ATPase, T2SS/T4P/T4SS family [Lachnoclostridium sp. Marseille-P6806]